MLSHSLRSFAGWLLQSEFCKRGGPIASPTTPIGFSKTFEGSIDKYPVRIQLARNGPDLSGKYIYIRNDKEFNLKGTVDTQNSFVLSEFDSNGNQTGVFKGNLSSDSELNGTWTKPNGNTSLAFSLRQISPSADAKPLPQSTQPPVAQLDCRAGLSNECAQPSYGLQRG